MAGPSGWRHDSLSALQHAILCWFPWLSLAPKSGAVHTFKPPAACDVLWRRQQVREQALEANGGQGEPFSIAAHLARPDAAAPAKPKTA